MRWMYPADAAPISGHPAPVALMAELESRGCGSDLVGVRQIAIMGEQGPVGVELTAAVT